MELDSLGAWDLSKFKTQTPSPRSSILGMKTKLLKSGQWAKSSRYFYFFYLSPGLAQTELRIVCVVSKSVTRTDLNM